MPEMVCPGASPEGMAHMSDLSPASGCCAQHLSKQVPLLPALRSSLSYRRSGVSLTRKERPHKPGGGLTVLSSGHHFS